MGRGHTSLGGHIDKVIAVVAEEQILPQLRRVQVLVPIVVKVGASRAHAPATTRGKHLAHIDKAGPIVAKERVPAAFAIDPVQVYAVKIERSRAAAFGLGDIKAAARVDSGQAEFSTKGASGSAAAQHVHRTQRPPVIFAENADTSIFEWNGPLAVV